MSLGLVLSPALHSASAFLLHALIYFSPFPLVETEDDFVTSQTLGMQELCKASHYTLPVNSERNEAPMT
jgi:hypothetical protein